MRKTLVLSLLLLLIGFVPLSVIHPAKAYISSSQWGAPTWTDTYDPFNNYVSVGYVSGSTWTLNLNVYNSEYNGSVYVNVKVVTVAVWFDWNTWYNTSRSDVINAETNYVLTVTNTTAQSPTPATNLFTHSYRIYVIVQQMYQSSGGAAFKTVTWGPDSGSEFAVIPQIEYSAYLAENKYYNLYDSIPTSYLRSYADSFNLFEMAETNLETGLMYYGIGNFSSAISSFNTAYSMLNQSFALYTGQEKQYNALDLNQTKADLNLQLAQINQVNANASYYTAQGDAAKTLANGQSSALMINSVGFLFFGLGFIVFGMAAVSYARKPKSPPS